MTRQACHVCGAPYGKTAPLYCPSCRAKQAVGVADLDAYRANPERFDLVERHPAYAGAIRWKPRLSATRELLGPLGVLVMIVIFAGGMAAIVLAADDVGELGWAIPSVAALMMLFGVVRVAMAAWRLRAPTRTQIAVIAEDVFKPQRNGDPLQIANHRVTLRDKDGTQRTVFATSELMGHVALADIGIAYTQGPRLVDFRVLDVMPAPLEDPDLSPEPTCTRCAAPYTFESRIDCAFCGAPLDHPDLGEHGARFERLRAAPKTAAALAERAVLILPDASLAIVLLALAALVLYGTWLLRYLFPLLYDVWPPGLVIAIPVVIFLCFAAVYGHRRLAPRLTRRRRELVRVVREREDAWMAVNGRPVYAYFVTLAGPGGGRIERRAEGTVARMVEPGMFGVAHIQGSWLANFTRIEDEP